MRARLEGTPVRVLGLADLISAKRASAKKRPASSPKAKQDDADLAWLLAERARLRKTARE